MGTKPPNGPEVGDRVADSKPRFWNACCAQADRVQLIAADKTIVNFMFNFDSECYSNLICLPPVIRFEKFLSDSLNSQRCCPGNQNDPSKLKHCLNIRTVGRHSAQPPDPCHISSPFVHECLTKCYIMQHSSRFGFISTGRRSPPSGFRPRSLK